MSRFVDDDWLKLDNAAKIYPSTSSEEAPAVFRLSATLERPIRVAALQQAYSAVLTRCPYFQVYLKRGVFWHYLQKHTRIPPIELLQNPPILTMPIHRRDVPLLRLQARGATLALDISHVLTDGLGGTRFLITLVAEYLRFCGIDVKPWDELLDTTADPDPEEYEDEHKRHFESGRPKPASLSTAYHLPAGSQRGTAYRVLSGRMPVSSIVALAGSLEVSVTEYLVALYIDSLARVREQESHTRGGDRHSVIRIQVPVNMRPYYSSRTMRNFSLFVSPEVDLDLGSFSFCEIARKVHLSMRMQLDRKELQRQISRNVGGELNPLIRGTPLVLKDLFLSAMHNRLGAAPYSGIMSNLGKIETPQEMSRHVRSLHFLLGPNPAMRTNCSVLSFNETLTVSFGSVITSRELERSFFSALAHSGVHVQIKEF